jgi:PAS domain S-box-containing protein
MGDEHRERPRRAPRPRSSFDLAAQLAGLGPVAVGTPDDREAGEGPQPSSAGAMIEALLGDDPDVAEALDRLLAGAIGAGGAYAGALTLGPTGGVLRIVSTRGYPRETVEGLDELDLSMPVPLTEAARARAPLWLPSWGAEAPPAPAGISRPGRTAALCALPLRTHDGRMLGVLGLSFESAGALDDCNRGRLVALADQTCMACELLAREALGRRALAEIDRAGRLLETVLDEAPVGLAFFDTDGRYLRVNQALERMNGVPAADHVGRTVPEVLASLASKMPQDLLHVISTGEPVIDREITGETPAVPGERRHWLASYYPVHGGDGTMLAVGVVVAEITDRKRAEVERARLLDATHAAAFRLALLADAGEILGASLDLAETIDRLLDLLTSTLGEVAALLLPGPDGLLRVAAARHADDGRRATLAHLRDNVVPPGSEVARVFETGSSLVLDEIGDDMLRHGTDSDEHYRAARDLAPGPSMLIPMTTRARVTGVLALAAPRGAPAFVPEDVAVVEELARRAAIAIDNAELFTERTAIADALQRSLLPPHLPVIDGLILAANYHPAGRGLEVGGDFYDVFRVASAGPGETGGGDRDAWAVMVGDVVGNGARAAAVTALVRHTARAVAPHLLGPAEVVQAVNTALLQLGDDEQFCTLAYGHVRRTDGGAEVELVSGGHPPPLLLLAGGGIEEVSAQGTLLGQFEGASCQQVSVTLAPGDVLVLFTDGVIEARSPRGPGEALRFLGEEGLVAALAGAQGRGAAAAADAVATAVLDFTGGDASDDFAVLALEVTAP